MRSNRQHKNLTKNFGPKNWKKESKQKKKKKTRYTQRFPNFLVHIFVLNFERLMVRFFLGELIIIHTIGCCPRNAYHSHHFGIPTTGSFGGHSWAQFLVSSLGIFVSVFFIFLFIAGIFSPSNIYLIVNAAQITNWKKYHHDSSLCTISCLLHSEKQPTIFCRWNKTDKNLVAQSY